MEPAALSQQYYVGQNGEQNGPFSEAEIVNQIRQGMVGEDALVWHDGMAEWQPIKSIERFLEAFQGGSGGTGVSEIGALQDLTVADPWGSGPTSTTHTEEEQEEIAAKKERAVTKKGLKKFRHSEVSTFAFNDKEAKPIYRDGAIRAAGKYLKRRFSLVFFGGILFAVAYGGYHLFISMIDSDNSETPTEAPKKRGSRFPKSGGRSPAEGAKTIPVIDNSVRAAELQKAKADLLLNSDQAMRLLEKLVEGNPEDLVGKDALETALTYYKTNQRRTEAGRLYMKAKRNLEASKFFLEDPPSYDLADQALFAAYQQSRSSNRSEILIQDIQILLGPLNRPDVARERIKILEKNFPRLKHPFAYYLKSIDGRIADIFNRLSFYFVQNILQHVATEFQAMTWTSRPVVEILRLRDGKYRIAARYRGDVLLSRDQLRDINFVFWLDGEQWKLVETNVTEERQRFSAQEKERQQKRAVLASSMLEYLENLFRTRFPKSRLHEAVSETNDDRKNASE